MKMRRLWGKYSPLTPDAFMELPQSQTSVSLLGRICRSSADEGAWTEFVERYAPRIYSWCQHRGLQQSDAEDVTQTVLSTLFRRLRSFQYDPDLSFRAWLKKVTHDALNDFFRSRGNKQIGTGDSGMLTLLDTVEARDQLERRLEELFDLELLNEALARIEQRVLPIRWQAFQMTAIEGLAAAEVAQALEIKIVNVYSARNKIQQMIRQEITRMEQAPASTLTMLSDATLPP